MLTNMWESLQRKCNEIERYHLYNYIVHVIHMNNNHKEAKAAHYYCC